METLSAAQEDSSGANPSSIKSEDNSPRRSGGRGSPPPNCAICLGTCKNKSFTDSCLHQFCFKCLLTWSKVKAVCPLCKQNFRSIIHNVRSNDQYEEYLVEQRHTEENVDRLDLSTLALPTRRFRYRTTLTLPRRETIAIQQLLLHYPLVAEAFPRASSPRRRRSPASFRRTVYRHNLWARPLPDFTGRFRDCSPEFYRYNETQMHRLIPWLNRELHYLLNENIGHITYVLNRMLDLLRQYHINSTEFRDVMRRYFGDRTEHFLHELYCFASTPYDMIGYDRNVQYTTDTRISTMVNEVISSSDSDATVDSDIMMVSSSEATEASAGPSSAVSAPSTASERAPAPTYPHHFIPTSSSSSSSSAPVETVPPVQNVIPIETISHSDSDDDSSEVMVVGYIKPPQDRTPEIVDLLGSDSDVVVQESTQLEPEAEPETERAGDTSRQSLVKLSMKMHRSREQRGQRGQRAWVPRTSESEESDASARPPASKRRRPPPEHDAPTTSDTSRSTPSPIIPLPRAASSHRSNNTTLVQSESTRHRDEHSSSSMSRNWSSSTPSSSWSSSSLSSSWSSSSPSSESSDTDFSCGEESSSSSDCCAKRSRISNKKSKKKKNKGTTTTNRSKKKYKKRTPRTQHKSKKSVKESSVEKDQKRKLKSNSGKGVKHSKKSEDITESENLPENSLYAEQQAGPSGISRRDRQKSTTEKSLKKHKESSEVSGSSSSLKNEEQPGPSGISNHHKQKHSSDKRYNEPQEVSASSSSSKKKNEQKGSSGKSKHHKQKSNKDKPLKKSKEVNRETMSSENHSNEREQPLTNDKSNNHKHKSVKEKPPKEENYLTEAI